MPSLHINFIWKSLQMGLWHGFFKAPRYLQLQPGWKTSGIAHSRGQGSGVRLRAQPASVGTLPPSLSRVSQLSWTPQQATWVWRSTQHLFLNILARIQCCPFNQPLLGLPLKYFILSPFNMAFHLSHWKSPKTWWIPCFKTLIYVWICITSLKYNIDQEGCTHHNCIDGRGFTNWTHPHDDPLTKKPPELCSLKGYYYLYI